MELLNPLTVSRGDKRYLLKQVLFTAASGQISFTLPSVATNPDTYRLAVNGIEYDRGTHYLVSGTTLTWMNLFALVAGDRVTVVYQI
jgi:hypothetical protein